MLAWSPVEVVVHWSKLPLLRRAAALIVLEARKGIANLSRYQDPFMLSTAEPMISINLDFSMTI